MQTIAISMYDENGDNKRVDVAARIVGDLALHRVVNIDGTERAPRRWRVSHIGTGAAITSALPYVSGKPREGTAPMAAYLEWMREVQATSEYRRWAEAMTGAPFGLTHPSKLGARCTDASRQFAAKARSIDAHFCPR